MIFIAAHNTPTAEILRWTDPAFRCSGTNDEAVCSLAHSTPGRKKYLGGEFICDHDPTYDRPGASVGDAPIRTAIAVTANNQIIEGEGADTVFRAANGSRCNVFRTLIDDPQNIVWRDLMVDPNAVNNPSDGSADWQEIIGISTRPLDPNAKGARLGAQNCFFENAVGLAVAMYGDGAFVRGNRFKGSMHDVMEVLTGDGAVVDGNLCELVGGDWAPTAFGDDNCDNVTFSNNTLIAGPRPNGLATVTSAAFRTWGGRSRKTLVGNHVIPRGPLGDTAGISRVVWAQGYCTSIIGNNFTGHQPYGPSRERSYIQCNGGTIIVGNPALNYLEIVYIDGSGTPSLGFSMDDNLLNGCGGWPAHNPSAGINIGQNRII